MSPNKVALVSLVQAILESMVDEMSLKVAEMPDDSLSGDKDMLAFDLLQGGLDKVRGDWVAMADSLAEDNSTFETRLLEYKSVIPDDDGIDWGDDEGNSGGIH